MNANTTTTSKVLFPNRVAAAIGRERETDAPETPVDLVRRCGGLNLIENVTAQEHSIPVPVAAFNMSFSRVERNLPMVTECASLIINQVLDIIPDLDVVCGVPKGGLVLGQAIATTSNRRYVFLECEAEPVPQRLVLNRHHIDRGEMVALVQDQFEGGALVEATDEVGKQGGTVAVIFCFYNSSGADTFGNVPIISVVKKETPGAESTAKRTMQVAQQFGIK